MRGKVNEGYRKMQDIKMVSKNHLNLKNFVFCFQIIFVYLFRLKQGGADHFLFTFLVELTSKSPGDVINCTNPYFLVLRGLFSTLFSAFKRTVDFFMLRWSQTSLNVYFSLKTFLKSRCWKYHTMLKVQFESKNSIWRVCTFKCTKM